MRENTANIEKCGTKPRLQLLLAGNEAQFKGGLLNALKIWRLVHLPIMLSKRKVLKMIVKMQKKYREISNQI